MFSNSLKYLVRALSFLARESNPDKKFGTKELATKINAPAPYLGKLMQLLVKNDMVSSVKGPKGGFYLSKKNREVSLNQVIFLLDGQQKFDNCILNFEMCNLENPCPLHHVYSPIKSKLTQELKSIKIDDL